MSRPPRVLLLCDRLDIAGGVERFVCGLANHLVRQGMDVAVGSVDTVRAAVRYPLDPAVRVLAGAAPGAESGVPAGRVARAWQLLRTQWRIGRALRRVIREAQPDVIVLNGLTTACSVLLGGGRFAARCICCDHNHFGARSRLWQWLRARLYPRVAAIVSLTEADAARYREIHPRTEVIHNAASLRARAPASPVGEGVLAVGRHVAQKGFDLLLRAWVQVAVVRPAARLRVAGDGPLRSGHEALARTLGVADRIDWLAPTPEVERLYREAAVFVLPSRYEGMPLALLEAQALGVPSVAFDCPTGPAEILTPATGRLVPAGDVAALAAAIVELLADPGLRVAMGEAAIVRSDEAFGPEQHAARWTALVRRVALESTYGKAVAA